MRTSSAGSRDPVRVQGGTVAGILAPMGFNPERQHRRSPWDIVFVASALVVAAGLVAWALFG